MTNKKFKVAAMSMALTACVAAQPLIANAADDVDAVKNDAGDESQSIDPTVDEHAADETVSSDNTNHESEGAKEVFGEDVDVDYKPATKNEDGSNTAIGDIVKNDKTDVDESQPGQTEGDDGQQSPTEGGNDQQGQTEGGDNQQTEGEKIGEAEKTETPSPPETIVTPKPGAEPIPDESGERKEETTENPDGSTDIKKPTLTPGTETTTTTGTGTATGKTTEDEHFDQVDLEKELGANSDINWDDAANAEKGTPVGDNGYKIDKVETTDNKQTLTLVKEDPLVEGEMTAEDIAKLVDAEVSEVDDDGYYTLTRTETYVDENGNEQTRTTYITVKEGDSHVTIRTTTTLVVSRERTEHTQPDDNTVEVKNDFKLPDITLDNQETISSAKLKELIEKAKADPTTSGTYTVTEKTDEYEREYTITVNKDAAELSPDEIADYLGSDYKVEVDKDGKSKIYYVGNGQHAELSVEQTDSIRELLSYTITVKETKNGEAETVGKDEAIEKAKTDAIKNALKNAVGKMDNVSEADAKELSDAIDSATVKLDGDGTFIYTTKEGKTYTLNYKGAEVTYGDGTPAGKDTISGKDPDKITDVKDNVVNGSSYVSSGKVEWKDGDTLNSEYTDGNAFTVPDDFKLSSETTTDGVTKKTYVKKTTTTVGGKTTVIEETYVVTEQDVTLTKDELEDLAWKQLEAKYNKTKDQLVADGVSITEVKLDGLVKKIDWTFSKTEDTTNVTDDEGSYREISLNDTVQKNDNGTYTIKINGKSQSGFESSDGKTFTKKEGDKTITVTVTDGNDLGKEQIREIISKKYDLGGATLDIDLINKTASYTDASGKKHTFHYSNAVSQTISMKEETKDNINKTKVDDLVSAVKEKMNGLEVGDQLQMSGKKTYTIKKNSDGTFTITDGDLKDTILNAAEIETQVTDIIKEIASNYINYGDLTEEDIWNLLDLQQVYADGTDNEYSGGWDSYWPEKGYENILGDPNNNWAATRDNEGNTIGELPMQDATNFDHLGLDAEVTIEGDDGTTFDGLILSDNLSFEYGHKEQVSGYVDKDKYPDRAYSTDRWGNYNGQFYDKDKLHNVTDPDKASLSTDIKEVQGQIWNNATKSYDYTNKLTYTYKDEDNTNAFNGKRFYNISGSVAYDKRGEKLTEEQATALRDSLLKDNPNATIVPIIVNGKTVYNVYANVTNIEAIGYMTASANTSYRQNRNDWVPGCGTPYNGGIYNNDYDLRIQGLKLVNGKVQGNYGVKYSLGLTTIRNTCSGSDDAMTVDKTTTTAYGHEEGSDSGSHKSGQYSYTYEESHRSNYDSWTEADTKGTSSGTFKSFINLIENLFTGEAKNVQKDDGSFTYEYSYTTETPLQADSMDQTTVKTAKVTYTYKTVEKNDVMIPTWDIIHVDPETPDGGGDEGGGEIIDEKTPESPILPGNVELPPVQDARPDAPVLPADPVLPAVQDAHALPQTGVNWLTAIGLALSGMTLMITGAFASLTGKNARH